MKEIGKNIGVAVLDTGITPHIDFGRRIAYFADYVKGNRQLYDDNGHGTHVAGILAGDGSASNGKYKGIAPGCQLWVFKILDHRGMGDSTNLIGALSWILENGMASGIRIVNISAGGSYERVDQERSLNDWAERLWDAGFVVVAAAGNLGPCYGSITAPGSCCKIITVGSSDMLYARKGASGRGPVNQCAFKPDILAPGAKIIACHNHYGYQEKSGTSMSTPVVSGAIACLLERYPKLTNQQIKQRLCATADDLNLHVNLQGCGKLNLQRFLCMD